MGGYAALLIAQGMRKVQGFQQDIETVKQLKRKPTVWDAAASGFLSGVDPSLSSGYWQTKLDRQNEALQRQEGRETIAGINEAINLQTAGAQSAINRQLEIDNRNLASTFAVSGGIRTGNYQRKVGELNRQGVEDVARVAQQGALQGKMMELGYTKDVQQFNLELAKLESAKASGDAQMIGVSAENLAPAFYDMFFKPKAQGETTVSNPEEIMGGVSGSNYNLDEQISGGEYPRYNESPTLDYIRNLYKPKPRSSAGMFAPQQDNTDPVSILWNTI